MQPDSSGNMPASAKLSKEKPETINIKALNYTELIPIIIKGMQEQDAANKQKDAEITSLKAEVAELRQMVHELKGSTSAVTATSGYLEQNTPNPVSGTTVIRYHLPETTSAARLDITNAKGQLVKTVNLNSRGTGQVSLSINALTAGTYNYTLYIEGKRVDTKRLVIAR